MKTSLTIVARVTSDPEGKKVFSVVDPLDLAVIREGLELEEAQAFLGYNDVEVEYSLGYTFDTFELRRGMKGSNHQMVIGKYDNLKSALRLLRVHQCEAHKETV